MPGFVPGILLRSRERDVSSCATQKTQRDQAFFDRKDPIDRFVLKFQKPRERDTRGHAKTFFKAPVD